MTAPRSTLSADYQRDWPEYFNAVEGMPPRDTLLKALRLFEASPPADAPPAPRDRSCVRCPCAIDVACGSGRDTLAMLDRGFAVTAVDSHPDALRRLAAKVRPQDRPRLHTRLVAMEQIPRTADLPRHAYIINASFALPFCAPDEFPAVWRWIHDTLNPGGFFAGQFFGDRDEWARIRPKSHHTRREVEALLAGYRVEHLDEVEKDGDDAMGGLKHHHVFHVVARKPMA